MLTFPWKGRKLTGSRVTTGTLYKSVIISQIKAESITLTVGLEQLPNTLDVSRKSLRVRLSFRVCAHVCVFQSARYRALPVALSW